MNSGPSGLGIKAENWAQKLLGISQHLNRPEGTGIKGGPRGQYRLATHLGSHHVEGRVSHSLM